MEKSFSVSRQRGFGALILIAVLAVTGASILVLSQKAPAVEAVIQQKEADALAAAKDALVAYAAQRGGTTGLARPGELPCPDTNNDGFAEATCNVGAIGRLPWRTLGIPQPVDVAGETPWYALAGTFRPQPSNTARINSNTRGNLVISAADQVTTLTSDAVAVIISPGAALGGQSRTASAAVTCSTTGTLLAPNLCAANYLETRTASGSFVATAGPGNWSYCTSSNAFFPTVQTCTVPWQAVSFNDRVLYIRTAELMPAVEMRVGNELKALLLAYRQKSTCMCYPWADSWEYSGGIADIGSNRGRFPTVAYPEAWGQGTIPALPAWVGANDWNNTVFYAAGRRETDGGGAKCFYCSPSDSVSVDGRAVSALVFTPGTAPVGIDRSTTANRDRLSYYLDDAANQGGGSCPGWQEENADARPSGTAPTVPLTCDAFVNPSSKAYDRDRVFTVSTTAGAR